MLVIDPAECAAHGLAPVAISITDFAALVAVRRFPGDGVYIATSGLPGGAIRVVVTGCARGELVEDAVDRWLAGADRGPIEIRRRALIELAGAKRDAVSVATGEGEGARAWLAARVDVENAALLVAIGRRRGPGALGDARALVADPVVAPIAKAITVTASAAGQPAADLPGTPPMTSGTTRAQRISWNAREVVALVADSDERESSTAALAMAEQLAEAGASADVIELTITFWARALDGLDPGLVPRDRLVRLDEDLRVQSAVLPALSTWFEALRTPVRVAHDLDWVIRFLLDVRTAWPG